MRSVALVTGASRGIGRAIARELAGEGYAVCVNYCQHRQEAEDLAEELRCGGQDAVAVQADVASRSAVETMVRTVERELGPVTLLVNNAGISRQCLFQDMDDETWGPLFSPLTSAAPKMPSRRCCPTCSRRRQACIVISPPSGDLRGRFLRGGLCRHQGRAGGPHPLPGSGAGSLPYPVNAVAPGSIETRYGPDAGAGDPGPFDRGNAPGRLGTPEDVAHAVAFLASEKASFLTGQILTADGGFTV